MNRTVILVVVIALLLGGAALAVKAGIDAQRPQGADTEQIQRILYEAERAAERRDVSGLTRFISEDYHDNPGMNAPRLKYAIRDWMRARRSVDVEIPSRSVRVEAAPDGKNATARFHVRLSADVAERGATAAEMDMSVRLAKERVYYYWLFPGEEWKVTGAEGYTAAE